MSRALDLRQLANKLEADLNSIASTLNEITDISNTITARIKYLLMRLFEETEKLYNATGQQGDVQNRVFENPFRKQTDLQKEVIVEHVKQIRSELRLLKDILDAITTRERLLLTEKNQLYKTLSEVMTKLAQMSDDVDALYTELEERLKKFSSVDVFKNTDNNKKAELLEENPYEYARRFTDRASTFDVDILDVDNEESVT